VGSRRLRDGLIWLQGVSQFNLDMHHGAMKRLPTSREGPGCRGSIVSSRERAEKDRGSLNGCGRREGGMYLTGALPFEDDLYYVRCGT
jgi:hypothetical protein